MSRFVPHMRPLRGDVIKVARPVRSLDWSGLGAGTNFCHGHGGMLIPWTAIGHPITSASQGTYNFYVAPKKACVERIWTVTMRAEATTGVTVTVDAGGAASKTFPLSDLRGARTGSYQIREPLTAKTNTAGNTSIAITANGGNIIVEAISCYEQTRRILAADTNDYGVDTITLQSRQPIFDNPGGSLDHSVSAVMDAYKNLDARRSGYFHWSTDVGSELAITAGSGSPASLFPLSVPMAGAIPTLGDTTMDVTCAVLAKVDAGTGSVRFQSDDAGDSLTISVTRTTYDTANWDTGTLTINAEDLAVADGRRSSSWEGVSMDAWVTATNTLNIQAISIVRPATANPI